MYCRWAMAYVTELPCTKVNNQQVFALRRLRLKFRFDVHRILLHTDTHVYYIYVLSGIRNNLYLFFFPTFR